MKGSVRLNRFANSMFVWVSCFLPSALTSCSESDELAGPAPGTTGSSVIDGGSAQGATPSTASAGANAVQARNCGSCHTPAGAAALSGSPVKLAGYPDGVELYAPNLTPDPDTGIGAWTDGQLRLAIREGVDREGMVLCPQMQHYRTMPDDEVDAIIKYLRSLPPSKSPVKESVCPPLKR